MSFGVKLILNIKKHQNLTILPKKSINLCKTIQFFKQTQANPTKLKYLAKTGKYECIEAKLIEDNVSMALQTH